MNFHSLFGTWHSRLPGLSLSSPGDSQTAPLNLQNSRSSGVQLHARGKATTADEHAWKTRTLAWASRKYLDILQLSQQTPPSSRPIISILIFEKVSDDLSLSEGQLGNMGQQQQTEEFFYDNRRRMMEGRRKTCERTDTSFEFWCFPHLTTRLCRYRSELVA